MAAASALEPGFICHVGDEDLLSIASVRFALGRDLLALQDLHSLHPEVARPHRKSGDERSLLAVLLLREAARERSPHMPYIMTFLKLPPALAAVADFPGRAGPDGSAAGPPWLSPATSAGPPVARWTSFRRASSSS